VITNDDMGSGAAAGGSGSPLSGNLASGFGQVAPTSALTSSSKPGSVAESPTAELDRMEILMHYLASLDQATLAKNALAGVDTNFPGRANWEAKLYAAAKIYSSQGLTLVQNARQIAAGAQQLQGVQDKNDPRVEQLAE